MEVTEEYEKKEMEMEPDHLVDYITKLQGEYYENHSKHILFKKQQKYDCASVISQKIDISVLFQNTLYILKNGGIYFDYVFFKSFIHPEIFDQFLEYMNTISVEYIDVIPTYSIHINVNTLTISAMERYSELIKKIFEKFPIKGNKMEKTYIYYTPSVIDQIVRILHPFIVSFKDKIVFYSKSESPEKIKNIL